MLSDSISATAGVSCGFSSLLEVSISDDPACTEISGSPEFSSSDATTSAGLSSSDGSSADEIVTGMTLNSTASVTVVDPISEEPIGVGSPREIDTSGLPTPGESWSEKKRYKLPANRAIPGTINNRFILLLVRKSL